VVARKAKRSAAVGSRSRRFVLWFEEIGIRDVLLVGGKNASLGEMIRELSPKGVPVPPGFAITASAYRALLASGLEQRIRRTLAGLNVRNIPDLKKRGAAVRKLVLATPFPAELTRAVGAAYRKLEAKEGRNVAVAVRSSATAEDLPDASFAGQQETYLNVRGERALLTACHDAFASLFTDRAISYRAEKKFSHFAVALSIGVQRMVRSDKAGSGVMFSLDTESGFRNVVVINASWGLGDTIVQGMVNPDEYVVFKPTLAAGKRAVVYKKLGNKKVKEVYAPGGARVKLVPVAPVDQRRFMLSDAEAERLARWAVTIERHYTAKHRRDTPMDMEWAKDGDSGKLFVVQARPETVHARRNPAVLERYHLRAPEAKRRVLLTGSPVGGKIGAGRVSVIEDVKNIAKFRPGEVLVTDMTDPDWEPIMKIASAIVTNRGGRTSHAAIISREFGIPAVVGTNTATEVLKNGQRVTVSCAEGDVGTVYDGIVPFRVVRTNLASLKRPKKPALMLILGSPEQAFTGSLLPNDGVGLAREEFIINEEIRIHPMALLHPEKVDAATRREIARLTAGYPSPAEFYVSRLAQGIARIAAAFYPKPVIVRLSDFKSNEYANLIGGRFFEPKEENPMLGWRGAARYYSPEFREAFQLEVRALKRVREAMGLTNVKVMVPVCRTPEEGRRVLAEMAKGGLARRKNGLEVYVMCEIPSNVILAAEFAKVFDGFSIGSNDLTQMTLGVDRDSSLVRHIYDERNPAVEQMFSDAIARAHAAGRYIGICGQGPSDYPELGRFLARKGIDSISLNPDTIVPTILNLRRNR
jgi:pyruvate,water dikinase